MHRNRWVLSSAAARVRQVLLLTLIALGSVALPAAASNTPKIANFPQTVEYQGKALNAAGQPLVGVYSMTFRYFDTSGSQLLAETLEAVPVAVGNFRVHLGTGTTLEGGSYPSLQAVFAKHPRLELEVEVDGVVYEPRLAILPAGHSLKSRLVAAGLRQNDDNEVHWKHYEDRNGATSFQSGILSPRGTKRQELPVEGSVWRRPFELPAVGPGFSRAARTLPIVTKKPMTDRSAREINRPRHEDLRDEQGRPFGTAAPKVDDELAGRVLATEATPPIALQFEGLNNITGVLPPDTEGAVGPNHYVQVVNSVFAIYSKTGTQLAGPSNTNTLWSGFGGPCQTDNSGDAIFLYDQMADRFVLTQFAVAGSHQSVCFAVSQTPDPTGSYYLYEFVTPRFPDYYKVGVWPAANNNAYFFGTNSGAQSQYDVFAVDRANMLNGATARPMQFFQNFTNLMMPADVDGPVGPAANAPGLFYNFKDGGESYFGSPASDSLDVYEFDVDWNTSANSTLTLVKSITPAQGLANFNWTVCGFFVQSCLPQPSTSANLDSASWWPMQRLVYRNFGSHESLVGAWTVDVNSTGNRAAPRWFELRDTGGGWSMYQQGTHSPDSIHRWMPSIAMDSSGNIAIGYSRGNGSNFASIYYATRLSTDPLGTLNTEALMFAATGAQTSTSSRWGDYSSMDIDPSDDCTFWYTTEYIATTGSAPWRTRIGSFKIPGCGGPTNNPPSVNISAPANNSTSNVGDSVSFSGSATDTEDGNLSASLSWTSSIDGAIGSGASFSTTALSIGSHTITASVTDSGGAPGSDSININVVDPNNNGPQTAVYDAGLGAPSCPIAGSSCDSVALLNGRANLGPEPNQPNTLTACNDGTSGSFHNDESNDRIVVSTLSGSDFTEGATVQIQATVYAWSTGSQDTLDLYYAANANSPSWVFIGSLSPPAGGVQTLTTSYTLPTGTLQAVRANFRYQGSASSCSGGTYDDHDDLVFAVKPSGANAAPTVTITAPANGSSFNQGASVSFSGTATDPEDGNIAANLAWSSNLDGSIGSGASFSTSSLSVGTHTITASVTDSGGASDSDSISITINMVTATCTLEDDFESGAAGWSNSAASTCTTGSYVLTTPTLQTNSGVITQVGGDHTSGGGNAIFTATNTSAGNADVDGGNCILDSPTWAVSSASTLSVWYFHGQRDSNDDPGDDFFSLEISTNNGASYSPIVSIGDTRTQAGWTQATTSIPAGSNVKLRLQVSDGSGPGDLIEGGIDDLSICPQ